MVLPLEALTPYSAEPPRLLADVNYNEHIVRALRQIRPDMIIVSGHAAGLDGILDPAVLEYAARHDLILITHDIGTMPAHFAEFLTRLGPGTYSPGVWYTPQTLPVGAAVRAIIETWLCSAHAEHRNRGLRLP